MEENRSIQAMKFETIPDRPEMGKWYRIPMPGNKNGNGSEYYTCVKLGKEKNVAVCFQGGGCSLSEYTAARPFTIQNLYDRDRDAYYFDRLDPFTDGAILQEMCDSRGRNVLEGWNIVSINYSTGDFHVGERDFVYRDRNGENKTLYHRGHENFRASMAAAMTYFPEPEKLLLIGASAGGFGAAMLADEAIGMFPKCTNITCCVDSSLLLTDWRTIAETVWGAPKQICERIKGKNLTLDAMRWLYEKYGEKVKYLFTSSVRDAELSRYQSYFDGTKGKMCKKAGDIYHENLCRMSEELQKAIPSVGLFFCVGSQFPESDPDDRLTQHGIVLSPTAFECTADGKSAAEWLRNAVDGKVEKLGMGLL